MNHDPSPEAERALKKFFGIFIATLFLYVTVYGGCEAYRVRNGAWHLTFDKESDGTPVLRIDHPRLLATGPVSIRFPGEDAPRVTNGPITYVYSRPDTNTTPFGPMYFIDTTQLPGTVALGAFGHVVEMIPRTVFVDFREVPWMSGTNLTLSVADKPSPERLKARDQRWKGR